MSGLVVPHRRREAFSGLQSKRAGTGGHRNDVERTNRGDITQTMLKTALNKWHVNKNLYQYLDNMPYKGYMKSSLLKIVPLYYVDVVRENCEHRRNIKSRILDHIYYSICCCSTVNSIFYRRKHNNRLVDWIPIESHKSSNIIQEHTIRVLVLHSASKSHNSSYDILLWWKIRAQDCNITH